MAWMEKGRRRGSHGYRYCYCESAELCLILLDIPEAKPAAMELLSQWVLPNVTFLRTLPRTSACSYEDVVFGVYALLQESKRPPRAKACFGVALHAGT